MEVLSRRGGAGTVLCVLVLCLLGLSQVRAQVTANWTTTQPEGTTGTGQHQQLTPDVIHGAGESSSMGDVMSTTTATTTSDRGVHDSGWQPVPERELLPRSQVYVFYQITTGFLRMIQPRIITDIQHLFDFGDWSKTGENFSENWQDLVSYLLGFEVCAVIGLFLFLIVPLSGCLIACCRCCGNCGGGKGSPRDGPASECGRCCCGFILFSLLGFVLTGGVLMVVFSSDINARLTGDQSVFDDVSDSFLKLSGYSQGSLDEIRTATLDRFKDTSAEVFTKFDGVIPEVQNKINATQHLDSLGMFANNLPVMEEAAWEVHDISANYTVQQMDFSGKLNNTLEGATSILESCTADSCDKAKTALHNLRLDADFSEVQLTTFIKAVEQVAAKDMSGLVSAATVQVNDVFNSANATLQTEIKKAKNSSKKAEDSLTSLLHDIEKVINPETFRNISETVKNVKDDLVNKNVYMKIPFWALLSLAVLVLLTVAFYYIGLLCGFCGKRPDPKGSSCCTWKTGSCWLLIGLVFTYLFYFILIMMLLVMFLVGGLVYTEICRHAYNLPNSEAKGFFDNLTQSVMPDNINFTLSKAYLDCANNQSLYTSLQLGNNGINLTSIINMDELNKTIDGIKSVDVNIGTVSFLPGEVITVLFELGAAMENVFIRVEGWIVEARKDVTSANLDEVASLLESAANATNNSTAIDSSAQELRDYKSKQVEELGQLKDRLATELDKLKHYTSQNLTAIVEGLMQAESTINNSASDMAKSTINNTADSVKSTIDKSVTGLTSDVESEIGRCHPIYDAMSTLINSACVKTLYPLNAYTFAMGMALIFLLPSILCAFKLLSLYRKTKPHVTIEDSGRDLYMAYQDTPYSGGKDTHSDMLLHRVDRPKSDYIAMADNPVYNIDDEMPAVVIPRAVIRTGTRVLPAQPAAPDERYFYAMPSHGHPNEQQRPGGYNQGGRGPPPRYTARPQ